MSFPSTPLVRPTPADATGGSEPNGPAQNRIQRLANSIQKNWFRCLIIAVAGFAVHIPALQGERLWDDHYLAHDNPFIKSPALVLETFRHYLFLDSFSVHYRPVQNISYMADYFLWNTNEFGFHLTNVLLHVGSGILLFFLLRRLIPTFFRFDDGKGRSTRQATKPEQWFACAAFLIALLWTVHPIHSAAIDYISGRADSLVGVFATGAWLLYLQASIVRSRAGRTVIYVGAALLALLAMGSREIAVVWVVLFIGHLLFVDKRKSLRAKACIILCCLSIVATYAGLRHLPAKRPVMPAVDNWSAPTRAAVMARALGDYGRLLLFPSNLHMERSVFNPFSYRTNSDWREQISAEYLSILGALVLAALVAGCLVRGEGLRMRRFGAFWFVGAYLPISNIVQLNATVAEHWLYLPSIGFLIFVAGCLVESRHRQRAFATIAIFAAVAFSVRSYIRSTDWVTPETFYRRTIAAGGVSARTGLNLGQIYADRGDLAEAERIFRRVLDAVPDYPIAQNNLASVLAREGKTKEAEALFAILEKNAMKSRTEYPCTWMGAVNLARMRHNARDDAAAIAIIDRAQTYFPEVWELIRMKSEILRETKGPDAALQLVEEFARINWWHHGAAVALGRLYAQGGDVDRAEAALRRAAWLDVHDTEALGLIVQMCVRQNKLGEAAQLQRRAVERQPDEPRQYVLLSDILGRMGRSSEAHAALAQAERLRDLVQKPAVAN